MRVALYARACSTSASKSAASSAGLRVPLDADDEAARRILERLERPVVGPRRLHEPVADAPDRLVVVRGHVRLLAHDRGKPRARLHLDGMVRELAGNLLVHVVADLLGQVLDEVAATRDVQELETAADRQRRHVPLQRRVEQRELPGVAARVRGIGLGVRLGAVELGVDVGAAREDHGVDRVERLLDPFLARRNQNGASAGSLDGLDVGEWNESRRHVPHPHLASCAYEVIPMTGFMRAPSPLPRVCRPRTPARGLNRARG